MQYYDRSKGEYVTVTPETPLPTSGSSGGGGTSNVNITGQTAGLATAANQTSMTNEVKKLATAAVQSQILAAVQANKPVVPVGVAFLSGEVDPASGSDYPKLIDLAGEGAVTIKIQCPKANTAPLLVSNDSLGFGQWEIQPGESEEFHYNKLYVSTTGQAKQNLTFKAWKYA